MLKEMQFLFHPLERSMRQRLPKSFFEFDFDSLIKCEKNPKTLERLIGLNMVQQGRKLTEVALLMGKCRNAVGNWLKRFLETGYAGLIAAPRPGRSPRLPRDQEPVFVATAVRLQATKKGGRVTARDFQIALQEGFSVDYAINTIYDLLKRIGLSCTTGRPRHPKSDPAAQEEFKKNSKNLS